MSPIIGIRFEDATAISHNMSLVHAPMSWTRNCQVSAVGSGSSRFNLAKDPSFVLANPAIYPQGFSTAGLISGMSASGGDPKFLLSVKQLGLYFQDDWKVTNRLTLNLGLRWDKDFNLIGATAIQNSRTFQELTAIGSPYAKLPHDDNKDFSPRVGFAYDLTGAGKYIIRGGFGLYYDNVFQNIPLFMIQEANPTIYQGVFSISNPTELVPGTNIQLANWRFGVDPLSVIPPPSSQLSDGATGRLIESHYRRFCSGVPHGHSI